jgi:hypothetical protein
MKAGASVLLASVSEPDAIRVLLIEDGVTDRGFLADKLWKQGFAVRKIASLPGAPDAARGADVIVLHCNREKKFRHRPVGQAALPRRQRPCRAADRRSSAGP